MEVGLTGKVAFGVSFRSPFSSAWKRLRDARNGDEDVATPFLAGLENETLQLTQRAMSLSLGERLGTATRTSPPRSSRTSSR
jgi:hypothetical protein